MNENAEKFLEEYIALCRKYETYVASCGCCPEEIESGPSLNKKSIEDYMNDHFERLQSSILSMRT